MIKTDVFGLRDPFILADNGVYYLYGTVIDGNWDSGTSYGCYKNESGRLDGEWVKLPPVAVMPCHATKNRWAPEVHKYNGAYYMLATYFSENTGKRGCAVFKADSPEGPFKEISNGQITPREWDAIDGTLYVDKHGQPWMIFVHEWISTDDNIGRMDVAKLTDDLSAFASDTKEIFRADSPAWRFTAKVPSGFLW